MSIKFSTPVSRLLLALGLAAGALGAQAATGYAITSEQETMIQAGMTESQVKDLLGQPSHVVRFPSEEGPTWTYQLRADSAFPDVEPTLVYVDFKADGTVAEVTSKTVPR